MVNLRTLRRVLALDLGLEAPAIEQCIAAWAPALPTEPDSTSIPLTQALQIVAMAEAGAH